MGFRRKLYFSDWEGKINNPKSMRKWDERTGKLHAKEAAGKTANIPLIVRRQFPKAENLFINGKGALGSEREAAALIKSINRFMKELPEGRRIEWEVFDARKLMKPQYRAALFRQKIKKADDLYYVEKVMEELKLVPPEARMSVIRVAQAMDARHVLSRWLGAAVGILLGAKAVAHAIASQDVAAHNGWLDFASIAANISMVGIGILMCWIGGSAAKHLLDTYEWNIRN